MVKRLSFFLIIMIAFAGLMGCSSDVSPRESSTTVPNITLRPERPQDLVGRVVEIRGNKLEVAEIIIPEGIETGSGERFGTGSGNPDLREQLRAMTEAERQEFKENMSGQFPGQGQGQSGNPGSKLQQSYEDTGESFRILIPVGTPITKRAPEQGGLNRINVQIGEIKKGDILKIWVEILETDGESRVLHTELIN